MSSVPPDPSCSMCDCPAIEPENNPTPVTDNDLAPKIVCSDCRRAARKRELVAKYRADPKRAIAEYVEKLYSREGLTRALVETVDPWTFIRILSDRLVTDENTVNRHFDARDFHQMFVDKLIAMPDAAELHVLVGRGQYFFGYESKEVENRVKQARAANTKGASQTVVQEPDPWPNAVDGAALADEIVQIIRNHVWLPLTAIHTVTLYLFFTYAIEAFDIAPILGIESPTHRCGKTTLAKLIGRLCFRQLNCGNISGPALFRAIEKWHPTILIDEADSFLTDPQNNDIRGMINSGHEREVSFCVRAGWKKDDFEPRRYSTWCAKVVALIGKLPTTNDDRTIKIRLARKTAKDQVHKLRRHHLSALRPFQRQFARWTADHLEELRAEREPNEVEKLDDRDNDNWEPLIHIASLLGGPWPERARQAALALSAGRMDDTMGVELLSDIHRIFTQQKVTKMFTDRLPPNPTQQD